MDKIYILDGAMGTMIQRFGLEEADYHSGPFQVCTKELKGNNECLNITRPDIIREIHDTYISSGADIIETNTFSANRISQSEYGCEGFAAKMAYEGARIARSAADNANEAYQKAGSARKILVAGSLGPTSKSLSLSPDASDPAFRAFSFDEVSAAYKEQADALIRGGVDLILLETCFDALNVKAALNAVKECDRNIPVIVSVSVGDRSGRTLTGQTLEAFYTAISHYPLLAFGLNCSLGAEEMMPLVEDIAGWCRCGIICYPNAGLPNEMGGYDQTPEEMASFIAAMAAKGLLNITGGCCGTTPEHIRSISEVVRDLSPRKIPELSGTECGPLKVSGLETVTVHLEKSNFTNIGERTNVSGSRRFARLVSEGDYEACLRIAARQIEDGASIIDINMDDPMLDSAREMERFIRYISNDPDVAKAALMIDSSHWDTILAGLKNAQGKCIVNSISLKEGEEAFLEKARTINAYGAAMVVMAFDEEGQATTFERKVRICQRAYTLLTEKAGIAPENIIFDVNILSIGTGIDEHSRYAIDFIESVRWIKANLPGALTSGGISNLSFAFRGNNKVREAMHSAFLYHAVNAGLDMAIVNPSMLQVYDEIDPELLKCVEDVIFDTDQMAVERLTAKAAEMLAEKDSVQADMTQNSLENVLPVKERLKNALVKARTDNLETDLKEALNEYGSAVSIIEGPLMDGMDTVGRMFGEGKMFLPQVVKSAKVMRDAVDILKPYMDAEDNAEGSDKRNSSPLIVLATVKGDVHDIGKNITGIVFTCNGFRIHDLGVMVNKETILKEALDNEASIIAVSGLITPSLHQMEELCRDMAEKGMKTPLFIGGATTSAVHTAVRLAPVYEHVYYGADASASAVMAKRYIMDPEGFEKEQHMEQEKIREAYYSSHKEASAACEESPLPQLRFPIETYMQAVPADIPAMELPASEVIPFFDWKMFYAIWGVRYGSAVPEAMELMQLRRDAEEELEMGNFRIRIAARFLEAVSSDDQIFFEADGRQYRLPFMRQENGERLSLCDFIVTEGNDRRSPFGMFAISVHTATKAHEEGCCCPACSNRYEDLIGKTVRLTLAEAASSWLDHNLSESGKMIKPAIGYSSCPDHTLKKEVLNLLEVKDSLNITLTETYAMAPESSICGLIFIHPEARYPEIRNISRGQYEKYARLRGMDEETARRFLGHLLKA